MTAPLRGRLPSSPYARNADRRPTARHVTLHLEWRICMSPCKPRGVLVQQSTFNHFVVEVKVSVLNCFLRHSSFFFISLYRLNEYLGQLFINVIMMRILLRPHGRISIQRGNYKAPIHILRLSKAGYRLSLSCHLRNTTRRHIVDVYLGRNNQTH